MENVVHNHLKVNDYEIQIGQIQSKEIDFVATKGGQTLYIQVCYL
ncbi:MAG: ATP-binding protein, partial [Flavobacteriales bacterium]|nr:ATP-binding protein [Flavobacteriales bacterium]